MNAAIVDVAVVGGGVAGAYLAWRLRQARPRDFTNLSDLLLNQRSEAKLRVHLYEQSDRIGGRLYSARVRGIDSAIAELGGMCYYPTHRMVDSLVKELELPTKKFISRTSDNLLYLRGRRLRQSQLINPHAIPYRFADLETHKTPAELILQSIHSIIPELRRIKGEDIRAWQRRWEWLKQDARFNGRALYQLGFWEVLATLLSSEAYRFVLDAGGYSDYVRNWNAADAMGWFASHFLGDDDESDNTPLTLTQGFDRLPKRLVEKFCTHSSSRLFLQHQLISFEKDETQPELLKLIFRDREQNRLMRIKAYHLVLAMPKRALQLLSQNSEFFKSAQLQSDLESVIAEPAMKLFLAYKQPWWRSLRLCSGSSITDLPIKLTHYWETLSTEHTSSSNALLLASYNYGDLAGVWSELLSPSALSFAIDKSIDSDYSGTLERNLLPSQALVDAVQTQLQRVHGLPSSVPEPYAALVCDWRQEPYAGAWHLWKAGMKPWEAIPRLRHPRPDYNVYICGEAYSNAHAWVEGALTSAENVLQKVFHLKRPEWLPEDYDLGP
jgi:monoamine oxidase